MTPTTHCCGAARYRNTWSVIHPPPFIIDGNQQLGPLNEARPIRGAKAKGIDNLSEVIKIKNEEERKKWFEDKRRRESKRIKIKIEEQRQVQLEYMRKRKIERIKNENEEESNITLVKQCHHILRRQQNVAQNPVQTYEEAINNAAVCYKSLSFNVLCVS